MNRFIIALLPINSDFDVFSLADDGSKTNFHHFENKREENASYIFFKKYNKPMIYNSHLSIHSFYKHL